MLSTDEIRILRLMPPAAGDSQSPIVCELSVVSRSDNPQYEALSYAWDDRPPLTIQVSSNEVKVTPRLYNALCQLRLCDRVRNLWVDQLCINQWNLEEKAQQVKLMRSTYTRCSQCLVWLGVPPAEITDADAKNAFEIIRYLATASSADDMNTLPLPPSVADDRPTFNRAMEALRAASHGQNRWWDRAWTLQEAALPDQVLLLFGSAIVPWNIITAAAKTWTTKGLPRPLRQMLSDEMDPWIGGFIVHSIWINIAKRRWDNALETVQRWRYRLAIDPRDKVSDFWAFFKREVCLELKSVGMISPPRSCTAA
ncbi:heterokaryon incompatibility protein-domain-containing protein [Astrocystis sublimbata]|nr:heterokaryon incompatibility protein-domain-containing protein [Astrocystis sublimbata]